ncbi:MAG: BON domain-containing protein [Acidobacteriaceae bacterium]
MTVPLRTNIRLLPILAVFFVSTLSTGIIAAQNPAPEAGPGWSQQDTLRIAKEVQKKLGGLVDYNVFDWITYGFHDKSVVLRGYASIPVLKSEAANAIKGIPGVESVDNQIEVLPVSMIDNRIRTAVYNRIYTQPALQKYNAYQGTARQAIGPGRSVARMAGGIIYDPPRGYNAIHIIVKNSNVALYGVVDSESDAAIADMQAKSTPGVFSVDNFLIVPKAAPKAAKKK